MKTQSHRRITKIFLVILLFNILLFSAESNKKKGVENDKKTSCQLFLKEYSFDKLYLVFAGPHPSSPTSSFGHIFILLAPKKERPLLLWDTIDFSATINDVSSFDFFFKGIFGGLVGKYRIVPFFEKLREYSFNESRPLWLFPFRLSESEKKKFLLNVFNVQKRRFPYLFTNKNCASQIDSLLHDSINNKYAPQKVVFFPKNIIDNWNNRIGAPLYIESMHKLICDNLYKLSQNISNENYNLSNFSSSDSALLLNFLEWKYFHENKHLTKKEKKLLQKLRLIVSASKVNTMKTFNKYKKKFNIHPSIFFGSGIQLNSNSIPEFLLNYRFGLHEFFENTDVYPANNYLSLLKVGIGINKKKIFLNELLIFNQISLQPISYLSNYLSWKIGIGIKKKFEYLNTPLSTGLYSAIGYSLPIVRNSFNLSILMDVSPVYIQHLGFTVLFGPELIFQIAFSDNIKLMNNFHATFNFSKNPENITYNETNLGIGLSKMVNLILQYKYSKRNSWYFIKANYYIN